MADSLDELKTKSALSHRILAMTGSSAETSGHVFIRLGENEMLVRCRNATDWSPSFVAGDAMHRFDFDGNPLEEMGDWTAPPERFIGAELFKARPEVNCVIHGHPHYQVLCDLAAVPIRPIMGFRAPWGSEGTRAALEGIPVYPRSILIASPEVGRAMVAVMSGKQACILRGHGNVITGNSVENATLRAIRVESVARMCYEVALIRKDAPDIPWEDIEDAINPTQRASLEVRSRPMTNWNWLYYVKLLEEQGGGNASMMG
jgi:ribulose-5-phosphate 4-epimerase/fuculose-1-phosphate aldolase